MILNNSPVLWKQECHDLAASAWAIRRREAARLDLPVSMISWRRCLLEAKAYEAYCLAKDCQSVAMAQPTFGYAFYASKPVPTRLPVARVASMVAVTLLLALI